MMGRADPGVEANAQLTAWAAVALAVPLIAEVATLLALHRLLPVHVFLGLLLVPPILLKLGSAGYRFARYYTGSPRYRGAGPPEVVLRVLAPLVVLSTVALFASGVELWLFGERFGVGWLTAHKVAFVIWFAVTGIHMLAYLARAPRLVWSDLRTPLAGAGARRGLVLAAVLLGVALAVAASQLTAPFFPPA